MNHHIHQLSQWFHHQDPRILYGILGGIAILAIGTYLFIRARRPSAEEIERRRRDHIAVTGRITDGHLTDARTLDFEESHSPTPGVLCYTYRLAGVTYNCAQDVSTIPHLVRGYQIDQPVQIRYDRRNPGNSILVAEAWSGLRFTQST